MEDDYKQKQNRYKWWADGGDPALGYINGGCGRKQEWRRNQKHEQRRESQMYVHERQLEVQSWD